MQLFYLPNINSAHPQAEFPKMESQHIVKVLRKKVGDNIKVTNGKGDVFTCQITNAHHKACKINITAHKHYSKSHNYYLHMLVAPTKSNDRFEWFLEKATEIGIDEITPILTDNAERKHIKIDRYQKIVLSAMKQSLQYHLPKINSMTPFSELLNIEGNQKYIAHCHSELYRESLFEKIKANQKIILCIGPEGDFSINEVKLAVEHGFDAVSLGANRLRTETAAITACHSVFIKNTFL